MKSDNRSEYWDMVCGPNTTPTSIIESHNLFDRDGAQILDWLMTAERDACFAAGHNHLILPDGFELAYIQLCEAAGVEPVS